MFDFIENNPILFSYIILPLLIFFARICDVTLGTLRIIFVSRGQKQIAPILGFFEVFIWIVAISQIMSNLNNIYCYFAYAAGFAAGNYVGMLVEEKLAVGNFFVRIVTNSSVERLVDMLNDGGFGVTVVTGRGSKGSVNIIYSVITRKNFKKIQTILSNFDSNIFYTIEDVRKVNAGIFPQRTYHKNIFYRWRKGK